MVATSPVTSGPTPIERAKEKAKTAAREGRLTDEMPVRYVIPPAADFDRADAEFLDALDLRFIARTIIEETDPDFSHIDLKNVDFAWKRKGGKDKGQAKLCDTIKQNEVAKFHGGSTWFIWLAADHCAQFVDDPVATRAIVYSQLCRIGFKYDDKTGAVTPKMNPPDVSYFFNEIHRYGPWRSALTVARNVFEQPRIPGF